MVILIQILILNVIIQQTEQHFFKQLFIKGAVSFDNDTVFLPVFFKWYSIMENFK